MPGLLVALGGNALERAGGDASWNEARRRLRSIAPVLAKAVQRSSEVVLSHGNGPQVGALLRQNELAASEVPPRPLDVLVAETQGQIGYLFQAELGPALRRAGVARAVVPIVSRIEVARSDPAFHRPTKPVGRFYVEGEARLLKKRLGWTLAYDEARGGWRRVVPSPRPRRWVEGRAVRRLLDEGGGRSWVPVVLGGGGIPVVRGRDGTWEGVEAVVDKDRAASLGALDLGLDTLAVVTDVPGAAVSFGHPGERWLRSVSREQLQRFYERGEFAAGSMGPKVEAGLAFLRGGGRRFLITDFPSLRRALEGEAGTVVE